MADLLSTIWVYNATIISMFVQAAMRITQLERIVFSNNVKIFSEFSLSTDSFFLFGGISKLVIVLGDIGWIFGSSHTIGMWFKKSNLLRIVISFMEEGIPLNFLDRIIHLLLY